MTFSELALAKIKWVTASAMENMTDEEKELLPKTGDVDLIDYEPGPDGFYGITFGGILIAIVNRRYVDDDERKHLPRGGEKIIASEDIDDHVPSDWK